MFIDRISKGKLTLFVFMFIIFISFISVKKFIEFKNSDYLELNNNLASLTEEESNIDNKLKLMEADILKKEKYIAEMKNRMKQINLKLSNELFAKYIKDFNINRLVEIEVVESKKNESCNNVADYVLKYKILDEDFKNSAVSMAVNFVSIFAEIEDVDLEKNLLIIKHKI